MDIIALRPDDPRLPQLYDTVLLPSFPPAELLPLDDLREGMVEGITTVYAAREGADLVAAAVGDWSERSRVQLLSYLAVRQGARGGGRGGRLLEYALERWRAAYRPCAIVAELELPSHHAPSPHYGDPAARLRFYAGHGARALALPYFQPGLGAAAPRWYGMVLVALHLDPELAGETPDTVSGVALREFMTEYLEVNEGSVRDDPAVVALLAAMDRAEGCPLVPLADIERVPVARGEPAAG